MNRTCIQKQEDSPRWERLADFLREGRHYGEPHTTQINGNTVEVLPLAHPRQIARLGQSSGAWYALHQAWASRAAGRVVSAQAGC